MANSLYLNKRANERNSVFDIARGIAILLVVLGHSIQNNKTDFDNCLLFEIIYSFHMPLFMFISGCVCFYQEDKIDKVEWLKKRFFSLMVPFIVWIFVPYIFFSHTFPIATIKAYIINIIKSPDCGKWFLYVLFVLNLLLFLSKKISNCLHVNILVPIVLFYLFISFILNFFCYCGIGLIKWHYIFFFSGFLIMKLKNKFTLFFTYKRIYAILIVFSLYFIIFSRFWRRTESPIFVEYTIFNNIPKGYGIKTLILLSYKYLIPFGGISLILCFSKLISLFSVRKIFDYLGCITLEIYVLHNMFFNFINIADNFYLNVFFDFWCSLFVSIFMIKVLNGCILHKYLFGKFNMEIKVK